MSVYNPNIPQASDDPTSSQSDLLGNFGKLNTDWAVNHVPLTSGGNNGFHKFVQFNNVQGSDPTVTGLQSCVYPKIGPDSLPALFFNNASNVYQLTQLPVTTTGSLPAYNKGIVTPFGFTINTGFIPSGVNAATFAIPLTNSQIYTALLTCVSQATSCKIATINGTGLTAIPGTATSFYYLVIGN